MITMPLRPQKPRSNTIDDAVNAMIEAGSEDEVVSGDEYERWRANERDGAARTSSVKATLSGTGSAYDTSTRRWHSWRSM